MYIYSDGIRHCVQTSLDRLRCLVKTCVSNLMRAMCCISFSHCLPPTPLSHHPGFFQQRLVLVLESASKRINCVFVFLLGVTVEWELMDCVLVSCNTSPDITLCGWLGSKHQLTNCVCVSVSLCGWLGSKRQLTNCVCVFVSLCGSLGSKRQLTNCVCVFVSLCGWLGPKDQLPN